MTPRATVSRGGVIIAWMHARRPPGGAGERRWRVRVRRRRGAARIEA